MINAGERITVNNCNFGYLSHRIVLYLLNLHIKSRHTYFARVMAESNLVREHTNPYTRPAQRVEWTPTKQMLPSPNKV